MLREPIRKLGTYVVLVLHSVILKPTLIAIVTELYRSNAENNERLIVSFTCGGGHQLAHHVILKCLCMFLYVYVNTTYCESTKTDDYR